MSTSDTTTKDLAADHAQEAAAGAQQRASEVAGHASDAAHEVAGTAVGQAQNVKDETVRQAKNLVGEASGQLNEQAGTQTQRLSTALSGIGDELRQMADAGSGGTANEVVHQAAERAHQVAAHLDGRDPSDLLEDVRAYARRRPAMFLVGAAVAGLLAGRIGRGVKDGASQDDTPRESYPAAPLAPPTDSSDAVTGQVALPPVAGTPTPPPAFDELSLTGFPRSEPYGEQR